MVERQEKPDESESAVHSGFVALVGRPNSGKSTFVNMMLGENLCVVTPLPQTTRKNLKGIYNDAARQIVFLDTPGMHAGDYSFNDAMVREAMRVLEERSVDFVGYMVDLARPFGAEEDVVSERILKTSLPAIVIFNKCDACNDCDGAEKAFYARYPGFKPFPHIRISALDTASKDVFLAVADKLLPMGPRWFPEDELTDANLRFFVGEFIQKGIILTTQREVPHASMVEILSFQELENRHAIEAAIHVETRGQRGIIVGAGGSVIKKIQNIAQKEMYRLTGIRTTVKCHVKITPHWRDKNGFLSSMGYS